VLGEQMRLSIRSRNSFFAELSIDWESGTAPTTQSCLVDPILLLFDARLPCFAMATSGTAVTGISVEENWPEDHIPITGSQRLDGTGSGTAKWFGRSSGSAGW
jgi:hypothetical protein